MITYNILYEKLCSYDNLLLAYKKARKGKSKKSYVINFEKNLNKNLVNLQKELLKEDYYPSNLRNGVCFLGYRVFYGFKLLKKRNIKYFHRRLDITIKNYNAGNLSKERFESKINGWFGYAKFADTFNLRREILDYINQNISEDKEKLKIDWVANGWQSFLNRNELMRV